MKRLSTDALVAVARRRENFCARDIAQELGVSVYTTRKLIAAAIDAKLAEEIAARGRLRRFQVIDAEARAREKAQQELAETLALALGGKAIVDGVVLTISEAQALLARVT